MPRIFVLPLTPKRIPFSRPNRGRRAAALCAAVAPSPWSHATWVIRRHHKRVTVAVAAAGDHVFTPHTLSIHTSGDRLHTVPRYPQTTHQVRTKTRSRRAAALV